MKLVEESSWKVECTKQKKKNSQMTNKDSFFITPFFQFYEALCLLTKGGEEGMWR
jgi:hypothetical protein